ncbi:hypothetical protein Scep_022675 [Stephania cephalantha]|uniref:Uncharacterized protein n=1 Tax=Stephania cephalantha TaxID=152367 RepID=A0AAP0F5V5_9MAGN
MCSKIPSRFVKSKFLIRVDCQSAKSIFSKDVKNLAAKQIFARWQAILSIFDFDIEYIPGNTNSLPDFLSREFLTTPSVHFLQIMSKKAASTSTVSSNRFKPLETPEPNCSYLATSQHLICILEPSLSTKPLATQIACTIPPGLHFIPTRPHASIKFYENILISTHSVHFDHLSRENSVEIDYSKFKIQRVLSADEWCENYKFITKTPFVYKDISILKDTPAVALSYQDYIAAWQNILFFKDPDHHSWYISFRANCQTSFPQWWLTSWWNKFGPHEFIFPARVQEQFKKDNLSILQFLCKYTIPWILKWDYGTSPIIAYDSMTNKTNHVYLSQDISCKWWNKFNYKAAFATTISPSKPKTPPKLATFPSTSSSFRDVVSKPSPSSDMALILAKLQQMEEDNKMLRQQIETDNKQLRHEFEQVTSRCSSSPSLKCASFR